MYSPPVIISPVLSEPSNTFLSPNSAVEIPRRPATPATHLLPPLPFPTELSDLEDYGEEEGQKELTQLPKPRKFGKNLARRQLDFPDYAPSFVNYKALKKVCDPEKRQVGTETNIITLFTGNWLTRRWKYSLLST